MSAELLRRAATKLREHAEAATRGPWHIHVAGTGIRSSLPYAFLTSTPPETLGPIIPIAERHNGGTVADVEYFALMHPPVALALADLLDAHAESVEEEGPHFTMTSDLDAAFDVARAILREDTP